MDQTLPRSRYLDYFSANADAFADRFELVGDCVLVERIKPMEARTASGLYLAETKNQIGTLLADRPAFFRVLLPGAGYYDDETGEDRPLNCRTGDIVLIPGASVRLFSSFPLITSYEADSIGVTRDADIIWRFKGQDAFIETLTGIDTAAKLKTEAT